MPCKSLQLTLWKLWLESMGVREDTIVVCGITLHLCCLVVARHVSIATGKSQICFHSNQQKPDMFP